MEPRKTIDAILYDRVSSPLYRTYIVCWLCWNWQIVLSVFIGYNGLGENGTIEFIRQQLSVNWFSALWAPFLISIAIIGLFPHLENIAFKVFDKAKTKRAKIRDQNQNETRLTLQESMLIREQLIKLPIHFNERIAELEKHVIDESEKNLSLTKLLEAQQNETAQIMESSLGLERMNNELQKSLFDKTELLNDLEKRFNSKDEETKRFFEEVDLSFKILNNLSEFFEFELLIDGINSRKNLYSLKAPVSSTNYNVVLDRDMPMIIDYYVELEIIEAYKGKTVGRFLFTEKGKRIVKIFNLIRDKLNRSS